MPVNPTYPGVYVTEVPSGVRTIVGVSTSIACLIGRTKLGPVGRPVRIQSFTDFARTFGDDNSFSDMARYVRLFFLNGGTDCYVMRIANGATSSTVTLLSETKAPVLALAAKNAGVLGDTIRVSVDYNTQFPEATFNLSVFRWVTDSRGQKVQQDREVWTNLSMDATSSSFAVDVLNQKSKLVSATLPAPVVPAAGASFSGLALPVDNAGGTPGQLRTAMGALFGDTSDDPNHVPPLGKAKRFRISVDGNAPVEVILGEDFKSAVAFPGATLNAVKGAYTVYIKKQIEDAHVAKGILGVVVSVSFDAVNLPAPPAAPPDQALFLRITSANPTNPRDVRIQAASTEDAAVRAMLGQANGGTEVGAFSAARPAPTGIVLVVPNDFAVLSQAAGTELDTIVLDQFAPDGSLVPLALTPLDLANTPPNGRNFVDASGGGNGLREKLGWLRDAVNDYLATHATTARWKAELWGSRVAFIATGGDENTVPAFATLPPAGLAASFNANVRFYSLGSSGGGQFQQPGTPGFDGNPPKPADYDAAYSTIETDVDLFNLLVLVPDHEPAPGATPAQLYGAASVFCQRNRAFLIMDPHDGWVDASTAATGADAIRIGLVKDYSAVYFPRLKVLEDGREVIVGPAAAMAGLYARIDNNRGVWKAPAGTEADIRGVVGVDVRMSDGQDGIINPVGVNGVRVFPDGVVSWGARTNAGADVFASEYKYIPIRRLALFIEESLYRGLKWVVFEPNDTALWAQIRLNAGAFMHNLFRQGAFQGTKPQEAYFVKCDAETTTENDRNLGIVNIWVGFAPLKPAEFVILYLQQIAGQIAA